MDGQRIVYLNGWGAQEVTFGSDREINTTGGLNTASFITTYGEHGTGFDGWRDRFYVFKGRVVYFGQKYESSSMFANFFKTGATGFQKGSGFEISDVDLLSQQQTDPTAPNTIEIGRETAQGDEYSTAYGDQTGSSFEFTSISGSVDFEARFHCKLYNMDSPPKVLNITDGYVIGRFEQVF